MDSSKPTLHDHLSLEYLDLIDRLCDRFENDWIRKGPVNLADYLRKVPVPARPLAFRYLLTLELDYLRDAGKVPTERDYLERYPEFAGVIALCIARNREESSLDGSENLSTRTNHRNGDTTPESAEKPTITGYQVFEKLGRGGMGIVYRAQQVVPPRVVAIKMLLPQSQFFRHHLNRFRIETEALARLQHPNIVQVFEVGEANGHPFFTMEFCSGQSLDRKLREGLPGHRESARLVQTLAEGMEAAHQHRVVHRDLKPANVLLTAGGIPKIGDFGLARIMDREITLTATDTVLGTPGYMAPEQVRGGKRTIGPACDIYALGAILYECLAGRPPFKGANALETLRLVQEEEPVPPRKINPLIPRDLEIICLKCLRKDPKQRYGSSAALAADLAAFLKGDSIQARPPSFLEKTRQALSRYHTLAILLGSLVLLTLGAAVGAVWHFSQVDVIAENARNARQDADQSEARAYRLTYLEDMKKAGMLIRQGQFADLGKILDRHEPQPGREDLRDFFWYYARQFRTDDPLVSQVYQNNVAFEYLRYLPNGNLYLFGTRQGKREKLVIDPRKGQTLYTSPLELPRGLDRSFPLASSSADGTTLAVFQNTPTGSQVAIIDLALRKEIDTISVPAPLIGIQLSADARTMLVVSEGVVARWDVREKKQIGPSLSIPKNQERLSLSPDGRQLALTVRPDIKMVHFLDLQGGGENRTIRFENDVIWLEFSSDSNMMMVYQTNNMADLVNCQNHRLVSLCTFSTTIEMLGSSFSFSPDSNRLALQTLQNIWIYNTTEEGRGIEMVLRRKDLPQSSIAYHPGGTILTLTNRAGTVYHLPVPRVPPLTTSLPAFNYYHAVARSHGGDLAALVTSMGHIQIMDVATKSLLRTLPGPGGLVEDCFFMPGDRHIATVGMYDNAIRLWDVQDGRPTAVYQAGSPSLKRAAASPDGTILAAGDEQGSLFFWDRRNGQAIQQVAPSGHWFTSLAFSPSGKILAAANAGGELLVWDLISKDKFEARLRNKIKLDQGINCFAFSPAGDKLLVGLHRGLEICEIPAMGPIRHRPDLVPKGDPFQQIIAKVAFAPNGRDCLLVTGPVNRWQIKIMDYPSWTIRYHFRSIFFASRSRDTTWLGDDQFLTRTSTNPQVLVVDIQKGRFDSLRSGPLNNVKSLAFLPGPSTNLSTLVVGTTKREMEHRAEYMPPLVGLGFPPRTLTEDHSYRTSAASGIRLWQMPGYREIYHDLPREDCIEPPDRIAVAPSGRILASGSIDGSIWLWDPQTNKKIDRLHLTDRTRSYVTLCEAFSLVGPSKPEYQDETEGINHLAFSPDGSLLLALGSKGTLSLWNTSTWERRHLPVKKPSQANWAGFSSEGNPVLVSGGEVLILRAQTGELLKILGSESDPPITTCVCFPGGRSLVTVGQTGNLTIWDYQNGTSSTIVTDHTAPSISALAMHPDGKILASADRAGTVKLWNLSSRSEIATLESRGTMVTSLAFSPDGEILVGGTNGEENGGEILSWRAPKTK